VGLPDNEAVSWSWQWTVWNQMTKAHVAAYQLSRGKVGGSYRGAPVLLLHHTGRKSGRKRVIPLLYLADGNDLVIVASKGGSHKHPAWFFNLREMPETVVEVSGEKREVQVHVASPRGEGEALATRRRALLGLRSVPGAHEARDSARDPQSSLSPGCPATAASTSSRL